LGKIEQFCGKIVRILFNNYLNKICLFFSPNFQRFGDFLNRVIKKNIRAGPPPPKTVFLSVALVEIFQMHGCSSLTRCFASGWS